MTHKINSGSIKEADGEQIISKDTDKINKKKSILVTRGRETFMGALPKRGSSKVTIQWEEGVKEKSSAEETKHHQRTSLLPGLGLLLTRGSKWKHIQDIMLKLGSEEARMVKFSDEDFQTTTPKTDRIIGFGSSNLQKRNVTDVELTVDQEDKLEVLKQKLKAENDNYLKFHPELDILLMLVYRRLLKYQPDDPEVFVSNYVHQLNTHREELVLEEVDVPFDKPEPQVRDSEKILMDEEKEKITLFAKALVERCAKIASRGVGYVNITSILDSMLLAATPSTDVSLDTSLRSADFTVTSILASLLRSVAASDSKSSEYIAEEILESVLEHIHPPIEKNSHVYIEFKESVERFVKTFLKTATDKAVKEVKLKEAMKNIGREYSSESYGENGVSNVTKDDSFLSTQQPSRPILKKNPEIPTTLLSDDKDSEFDEEDIEKTFLKPESRVKFQSISNS